MAKENRNRWFLKQWRKARGLTQEQLADRTALSKPFISQLENGKRQYTQDVLELLAEALRCAPADLVIRDPTEPQGIWTIWDQLQPAQKRQLVEMAEVIKRTGTGG